MGAPKLGDFVRVRGRRWLVEDEQEFGEDLAALRLACVDDDAQGEATQVVWGAELDAAVLGDEGWDNVARSGADDPAVFAAYLRALRWGTATATDRDLFQAPFGAGIRLDAYQLLPLRKALRLPRVNLLIADDVGAGKTVAAGLVLREMLLRRRVDDAVVAAPAPGSKQRPNPVLHREPAPPQPPHVLMTDVTLDCGYPASALKERIRAPLRGLREPARAGVMIYTATAGTQGTSGGLVEVAHSFGRVLHSALERHRLCSGDPVCADHNPAATDEDRALNGAACHGCLLVSETSCEACDLHVDRALLVDAVGTTDAGFFGS